MAELQLTSYKRITKNIIQDQLNNYGLQQSDIDYIKFGTGSYLTEIDAGVLSGFENLETIDFSECYQGQIEIGASAFENCKKLKNILVNDDHYYFSNGVVFRSIKEKAFKGCENILSIHGSAIGAVGPSAFYDCKNAKIDLTDCSITSPYAFYNCQKVYGTPTITNSVGNYACYNCKSLNKLELIARPPEFGSTKYEIGKYAFANCTNLKSINYITELKDSDNNPVPDAVQPSIIREGAFMNCQKLDFAGTNDKTIRLANKFFNSLTCIEDYAFKNCLQLKNVSLNFKIDNDIGKEAFLSANLSSINIECNVIKERAFKDAMADYVPSNQFTVKANKIQKNAFESTLKFVDLDNIYIVDALSIEDNAFINSGIRKIELKNTKYLGSDVFLSTKLEYIRLPETYEHVIQNTFRRTLDDGWTYYDAIQVDGLSNVLSIDSYGFNGSHIQSIDIRNCEYLAPSAFAGSYIDTIGFSNKITEIDSSMIEGCIFRKLINTDSILNIKPYAFYLNGNLDDFTDVQFKNCLSIGAYAFYNSRLTDVKLDNCQYIGSHAFNENLTALTATKCVEIGHNAFRKSK